jgi:hypothetical protein
MRLAEIPNELRKLAKLDIVAIQCGYYFNMYNEDARLTEELFDLSTYEQGENVLSGFPTSGLEKYEELFQKKGLNYAFVEQEPARDGSGQIARVVRLSSELTLIGKRFSKSTVTTERQNQDDIFVALLNGYNPLTGEVFDRSSPWMSPVIQNDLRDFIQGKSSKPKTPQPDFGHMTTAKKHDGSSLSPIEQKAVFGRISCAGCGRIIPEKRIEAIPNTKLCVGCASDDPSGQKARTEKEPWGSRDDWKRDRSSWKRSH